MNLDDHNSNEQKLDKKLQYYDQDWPQQQQIISPRFTPQQFYLQPPQNISAFNLLPDQELIDKNKPKYPFRKLSAGEGIEQQEDDHNRHFYNYPPFYQQIPQQMKYPQNNQYMHKFPQPYPPPWYRPPYPPFYYPPYDMSQYQNTLSKELQSKVSQLVQYQKVSPFQCNCKKSKCLKLYCECFTNNWVCSQSCNCTECKNRIDNPNERSKAIEEALLRNPEAFAPILTNNGQQPQVIQGIQSVQILKEQKSQKDIQKETKKGCNCKKSECKKKYCECYSINQKCTDLCKCENCLNKEEQPKQIQPEKIENRVSIEMIQYQQQQEEQNIQKKQDNKSKKIKKEIIQNNKNNKKKKKN